MQKGGIPEYIGELIRYSSLFKSQALKMTRNIFDADDLVQSSFVRAIKYPPQNNEHLKAWMLRIMFSEYATKRRRKFKTEVPLGDLEKEFLDEDIVKDEISDEIQKALNNCEYGQLFYDWAVNETPISQLEEKYNLSRSGIFHKIKETKQKLQYYLAA